MYTLRMKFIVTGLLQSKLEGYRAGELTCVKILLDQSIIFVYAFKKIFYLINCNFIIRENQNLVIEQLKFSDQSLKIIETNSLRNISFKHQSFYKCSVSC